MSLSSWFVSTIHGEVSKCLCPHVLYPLFTEKCVNVFVVMVCIHYSREVCKCLCPRGLHPLLTEK